MTIMFHEADCQRGGDEFPCFEASEGVIRVNE